MTWRYDLLKIFLLIFRRILRLILLTILYHFLIYYYDRRDLVHSEVILKEFQNIRTMVNLIYKVNKKIKLI